MGKACSTHGQLRNAYKDLVERAYEKENGSIKLFSKYGGKVSIISHLYKHNLQI